MNRLFPSVVKSAASAGWLLAACVAALVSACGGGDNSKSDAPQAAGLIANSVTTVRLDLPVLTEAAAEQAALPTFHLAPVLLNEPDDTDAVDNAASARMAPRTQWVPLELQRVSTRRLTVPAIESVMRSGMMSAKGLSADGSAAPMTSGTAVATYSPAQIRAAYGLPALPSAGTALTATQAAQLGAGQTIYLIDAMNDPNVFSELTAFNQKFGLSACTATTIPPNASLPLAVAPANGCQFAVVFSTASGSMTATAPAYDSGWATEITLDVQWSHATAPLARIILIETPDASLNSLLGGITLANSMGPGIVSMSFGSTEGNWTASVNSVFTGANMSYLAATGDAGAEVNWPAVSPNVVAVSGTSLTYSGTGPRSEVVWSDTGGGTSSYTPTPNYQSSNVPGMGTVAHRMVADVAFNGDPSTGQYLAIIQPGSTTVNWVSAGGTSLSTPQWAGIIAIANAERAMAAKSALGAPHAVLYGQIASVPGNYASSFTDIAKGSDGSCAICSAKAGYDAPSGLGTPNGASLLSALSGAGATPPAVTPATINGTVGTALSFTVSVTAADPITYALSGAPSGMSISTTGAVTWATPVAGTYAVTVSATDTQTGLSGQGLYSIVIASPPAPVVASASISGTVGSALSFTVSITEVDPVTYTLSGAPAGMSISATGTVTWPTPVAGTYAVTVSAKDTKTGLSGQGLYTINIATQPAPVVASASISGTVGSALSFPVSVTAPDPVTYTLSGAPAGMSISTTGAVTWPTPAAGTYAVTVTAKDTKTGLSGKGVYTVTITAAAGPLITAPAMTGVAGKPLTGTISISDPGATSLSVSLSGVPMGMGFSINGLTITAHWASPVVGNYSMAVTVVDSAGLSAKTTVPITITAH